MRITEFTRRWSRPIAAAILVLTVLIVVIAFFPGRINIDSVAIMFQADTGELTDFHAPLLNWLWGLVYDLGVGPGWVLVAQVSACVAGIYSMLRLVLERIGAALGAAIVTLSPLTLGQLALIGRDTWYLAGMLITLGATAQVLRRRAISWPWVAVAVVGTWVALAARQNAPFAVFVTLVPLAFLIITRKQFPERLTRPLLYSAGVSMLAVLLLMGAQALHREAVGIEKVQPAVPLYMYDLAAMSVRDNENYFPESVMKDGDLPRLKAVFNPDELLSIALNPASPLAFKVYDKKFRLTKADELRKAWREAIVNHPLTYLAARSEISVREASLTGPTVIAYYPVNYGPDFPTEFTGANDASRNYMDLFLAKNEQGGILFTVWAWLLAGVVCAVVLLRRRTFAAWCLAAPCVAALAHQIGLFFGLQGIAYRFEYPAVTLIAVTAVACAAVAVKQWVATHGYSVRRTSVPSTRP